MCPALDVSAVNSGFTSGRALRSSTLKGSEINIPFNLCSRFSPCSRHVQMFFLEAVTLWIPNDWKPRWSPLGVTSKDSLSRFRSSTIMQDNESIDLPTPHRRETAIPVTVHRHALDQCIPALRHQA